jgi:hypothetical protein
MVKNNTYVSKFLCGRSILCLICIYIFMTVSISIAQTKEEKIQLEANYILECQYEISNDPAYGAINNILGLPTWVVPREMAMAILGLKIAADVLNENLYRETAQLAADYLVKVQDDDGAWFNQYHYADPGDIDLSNEFALSKSPTQTAEVMIAFYQLGYQASRYNSMKKGAQYLMGCQNTQDGLICGGKKSDGNYHGWRWTHDNAYTYWALKAAEAWAIMNCDLSFVSECSDRSQKLLKGINEFLYEGIWHIAVDENCTPIPNAHLSTCADQNQSFPSWIQYSPQMLDLPVNGVNSQLVGDWIIQQFHSDNACFGCSGYDCVDKSLTNRQYPGFAFQAALCWFDTGHTIYAESAIHWAETSGLWQREEYDTGKIGGFIDWMETSSSSIAPQWQRFIDTSFYAIACWNGGYDFKIVLPTINCSEKSDDSSNCFINTVQKK